MNWRERYIQHLRSPQWRYFKTRIIAIRGHQCERCGQNFGTLELHHKSYRRFGHEQPEDVELLCKWCHAFADLERTMRQA